MNKLFRKQDRDIGDFNRVKTYKKRIRREITRNERLHFIKIENDDYNKWTKKFKKI